MKRTKRGWFSAPAILFTLMLSALLVSNYREILDIRVLFSKNAEFDPNIELSFWRIIVKEPSYPSPCGSFCLLKTVQWKERQVLGWRIWFIRHYVVSPQGETVSRSCFTQDKKVVRCIWERNRTQLGSARITL
ncbi:hypothetical protein [Marinomonas balearica]|uniref:Uncharacterized protein n=1 Tax=Marinomonas balearica TaxID=491947 RepID=A0A4R6MAZ6_9GAMM|nr:hypothetical protein [Marinomonas balearica]TDO98748.1 hypothetical protein DFP79_1160 [Marinomonas balearica]